MKIAIITPGRSHLLDMSIQLAKHGHDVTFYTMVSKSRCEKFGFPRKNVVSFFWACAPLMFIFRKTKLPFDGNRYVYYCVCRIVDYLACLFLKECDIAITLSGCSLRAIKKARRKYGAHIICHRGAKHILEQDRILKTIPTAEQVFPPDIHVELKQYDISDKIYVPSLHAAESFVAHGMDGNNIFINPHGVNVSSFYPIKDAKPEYDVIFVGNWAYQKGVDLLVDACRKGGFTLLHVGNLVDCPFPREKGFTHVHSVNQTELVNYYAKAKVLALPSRQDGFGLVLAQAMACGLPLVYSHDTGGPDLRNLIEHKEYLFEMENFTLDALIDSLGKAIAASEKLMPNRNYLTEYDKQRITWNACGNRYNDFLTKTFGK